MYIAKLFVITLGHGQKLLHRVKTELIFALRAGFSHKLDLFQDYLFGGNDTWILTKVPEVAHVISFYPSAS